MLTKRPPRTARNTMMDLLARRDHSELELRQKLREREFSDESIEAALQYAKDFGWLLEPTILAEKFSQSLHKKKRGIQKINQVLRRKGLPSVKMVEETELQKALEHLQHKIHFETAMEFEQKQKLKAKAYRLLQNRGFTPSLISKAWKNFLEQNS